jgi:hypothetical protein
MYMDFQRIISEGDAEGRQKYSDGYRVKNEEL